MKFGELSKMEQKEVLASTIKELLTEQGLSYRVAAPRMAWGKTFFGYIVSGERNLDFLDWFALCKVLEINPAEFLERLESHIS